MLIALYHCVTFTFCAVCVMNELCDYHQTFKEHSLNWLWSELRPAKLHAK